MELSWVRTITNKASLWIDQVATAILAWREALRPPRFARLVEMEDGGFALQAPAALPDPRTKRIFGGNAARQKQKSAAFPKPIRIDDGAISASDASTLSPFLSHTKVELVLLPHRFLFRPLYLPRRAADFLNGIVLAQIDRLTPWSAAEAAFGCQPSADVSGERMLVTVAATARKALSPYVNAIRSLGVDAIAISTPAPEGSASTIKVLEQKIAGAMHASRLRRILTVLLIALALICAASIVFSSVAESNLEARREEVDHRIAQRRAALHPGGDANSAAARALEQRKRDTPSTVIVYEELSRVLPDDAYLTEMRVQGDKLQIVGLAHDAPLLIHLLEQSPHFTKATFFAPTTRLPSESGQHFFIEAHIQPIFPTPEALSQ
jgi:general secretion pathway protein L